MEKITWIKETLFKKKSEKLFDIAQLDLLKVDRLIGTIVPNK